MVISLDKIITAFIYVFRVQINILRDFRNLYKVLRGRRKYPELMPLMSESGQHVLWFFLLLVPHNTTQNTWPVPSLPDWMREGWRVRGGLGVGKGWEKERGDKVTR